MQNYPVLSLATYIPAAGGGGTTTVSGTLNSAPGVTYSVEIFANPKADPSGFGQGQIYLGSARVITGADGNATFTVSLASANLLDYSLSATATDVSRADGAFGDTSEFSGDVPVEAPTSSTVTATSTANPSVFGQTVTFTATVAPTIAGTVVPTGQVEFLDNGVVIDAETLYGGARIPPLRTWRWELIPSPWITWAMATSWQARLSGRSSSR